MVSGQYQVLLEEFLNVYLLEVNLEHQLFKQKYQVTAKD